MSVTFGGFISYLDEIIPKGSFLKDNIVNENVSVNTTIMNIWLDNVLKKHKLAINDGSMRAQITPKVKNLINKLAIIPDQLTKKLQPIDLTVYIDLTGRIG